MSTAKRLAVAGADDIAAAKANPKNAMGANRYVKPDLRAHFAKSGWLD